MDGEDSAKRRHLRPNRGKNPNARWIVDEAPKKKPAPKRRRKAPSKREEAPILEGETRCVCGGSVSDDRPMAECEKCKTWQHVVCEFGVDDESALPDKYVCQRCRAAQADGDGDGAAIEPAAAPDSGSDAEDTRTSVSSGGSASSASSSSGGGLDSIKDKVRRSVAEAWLRVVEPLVATYADSIDAAPKPYALRLALDIEAALYAKFADTAAKDPGHVYREQFRMLSFNLKDDKNPGLQLDVVRRAIPPERFVAMTSAELRPPEMRKLANEIKKESLHESIIAEPEPPKEKISHATAELNMEPTFIALDEEEEKDAPEEDEAMKEPLGPPPAAPRAAGPLPDDPVWQGRVRLGTKLDFAASATRVQGPPPAEWPQLLDAGEPLAIEGAVPAERAAKYLTETAAENAHTVASLVLRSPAPESLRELSEYLTSRARVGAVEHRSPRVKDAYIVPVAGDAPPPFLALDEPAKTYIQHVVAEHHSQDLLFIVLVLFN